jgi:hypothetical protein
VDTVAQLENTLASNAYAITENASVVCQSDGTVEFSPKVVLEAIQQRKHA